MRQRIKNIILLKSLFSKLMASFLTIILIVSSINLLSYKVYTNNIEREIEKNTNERLVNVVNKFDQNFEQIQKMLLNIYRDDSFLPVLNEGRLSAYGEKQVIDKFLTYLNDNLYIRDFFLLLENSNFVVSPYGTYDKQRFFTVFYSNPVYTEEFWSSEMKKPFSFNYYPVSEFSDNSNFLKRNSHSLMPVAFKNAANSKFIMVVWIDIDALLKSIEINFTDDLYIIHEDESLIYPLSNNQDIEKLVRNHGKDFTKTKNGYVFEHKSSANGFTYIKLLSDTYIMNQLRETTLIFLSILLLSFIISFIISVYIVKKFNNPVKSIAEMIKKSENSLAFDEIVDFKLIRDSVEKIVSKNFNYKQDINSRDSMLKTFFYESKLKNIYLNIHEAKDQFSFGNSYALIYFKIHYRNEFYIQISEEPGKATFLLMELIQEYLKEYFKNSVIFQPENDQIVSVVDVARENKSITDMVESIADKLKQEEEFIYFTIAISDVYSDVSELNKVYGRIFEIPKYRMLTEKTQILTERALTGHQGKFYFSLEQVNRLMNSLRNGRREESIQMIDEILELNIRKEVNGFYILLLCTEMINCCVKVLTDIYYDIPESLNINEVYSQLNQCVTLEKYKELVKNLFSEVAAYIQSHKKENDYIIDYVKEYVEKHFAEDIYLDLLADKLNITKTYLSSYFKNKTGNNLSDYINWFRIKKAMDMIENTSMKVQDIGVQVGIANTNTFIRLFKKYAGKAPGEYRKARL